MMNNSANHDDQFMIHNSANQVTFHPRWADSGGTHQMVMKIMRTLIKMMRTTIRMMMMMRLMMKMMTIMIKIIFQTEAVSQWF